MKKIFALLILLLIVTTWTQYTYAETMPEEQPEEQSEWIGPVTNRFDTGNEWFWKNTKKKVSWINTKGTKTVTTSNWSKILDTIQNAINRILWMLSFVALILCLRGWFKMLTAAWDDWKVKTWTKILKNAAIGLAVIWLSWLVVSFVFWIINKVSGS